MIAGPTFWPVEDGAEVLSVYREFMPDAPRELNGFFAFRTVPPGPAVPRGDAPAQGVRRRLVLRRRRGRGARRRWRRCSTRCPSRCCTACSRCRTRRCRARSTALYPTGDQWYWRADFVNEIPDEAVAAARAVRRRDADDEVDDAPVSDRRRGARRRTRPTRPGATATRTGARCSPASTPTRQRRRDPAVERRLLRGAAPVLGRRRVREHDDGRGPGAGARQLPRQLRPPGAASRRTTTRTTSSASTRTSSRARRER